MKFTSKLIGSLLLAAAGTAAFAQSGDWPTRPVRWIVPFAAGGTGDAAARNIAQKLTELWGQQVVIENKPGANTAIAAASAARSAPDGYTLFQPLNSTLTVNPHAFAKLPYDPVKDFTPIGMFASVPLIIVVPDASGYKTLADLLAQAKKTPGLLPMGGAGVGVQLAVERFTRDAQVKVQYVQYKSGADVQKGLLTTEIPSGMDGVPAYPPFLKTGKLRALATNSASRISVLPDVPTLGELGYRNSQTPHWHGLVAPAGLPETIRTKIATDLQAVLAMPELRDKLTGLGLEPVWVGGEQFARMIRDETILMGPLVKDLGIKFD